MAMAMRPLHCVRCVCVEHFNENGMANHHNGIASHIFNNTSPLQLPLMSQKCSEMLMADNKQMINTTTTAATAAMAERWRKINEK